MIADLFLIIFLAFAIGFSAGCQLTAWAADNKRGRWSVLTGPRSAGETE